MPYGETKVYFDGSHYIAIPHTERPYKRRPKKAEEEITVTQDENGEKIIPAEKKRKVQPKKLRLEIPKPKRKKRRKLQTKTSRRQSP